MSKPLQSFRCPSLSSLVSIQPLFLIPPFLELNYPLVPIDIVVFVSILVQKKLVTQGMNKSNIINTVTRDAEIYFIVVSAVHLLVIIMFAVARVRSFALVLEVITY